MIGHIETRDLNFNLPLVGVSHLVADKAREQSATLLIMPWLNQPMFRIDGEPAILEDSAETDWREEFRRGLAMGFLSDIQPLPHHGAFCLVTELPGQKFERIGTGIVRRLDLCRLGDLTADDIRASGHESRAGFMDAWDQHAPDAAAALNPWCWLVYFDLKG